MEDMKENLFWCREVWSDKSEGNKFNSEARPVLQASTQPLPLWLQKGGGRGQASPPGRHIGFFMSFSTTLNLLKATAASIYLQKKRNK